MTDILPTYRCFDDAMELIEMRLAETPTLVQRDEAIYLVHAICVAQDGTRYAHGWVEEDGQVWDAGLLHGARVYFAVAPPEYYAAKQVEEATRYTLREVYRENVASGHYGPWKPAYLALVGQGDRRILGALRIASAPGLKEVKR
jgi:hypothetical protein